MRNETWQARLEQADAAYDDEAYGLAFHLYLRLAMEGCADAQVQVGCMLQEGESVSQDDRLALGWYRLAAARSNE